MRLNVLLPVAATLAFAACATPSTVLQNANGQTVTCSASGFGYIGAPAALISHSNCVDEMQAKGYRAVDKENINPKPSADSNKVKFDLPAGWENRPLPAHLKSGQMAINPIKDLGGFVEAVSREGVNDLMAYAMSRRDNQVSLVSNGSATDIVKTEVNGRFALRFETTGTAKNGMRVTYITTIIEGMKEIAFVNVWSSSAGAERNRAELESIAAKVVGLS